MRQEKEALVSFPPSGLSVSGGHSNYLLDPVEREEGGALALLNSQEPSLHTPLARGDFSSPRALPPQGSCPVPTPQPLGGERDVGAHSSFRQGSPGHSNLSPHFTSGHPNEHTLVQFRVESAAVDSKALLVRTLPFFCSPLRSDPRSSTSLPHLARPFPAHLSEVPWVSQVPLQKPSPSQGPCPNLWAPDLPPRRGYVWYCQAAHSVHECGRWDIHS